MNGIKSDWTALRQVSYRAPYLVVVVFFVHVAANKKHNKIQASYNLGSKVHVHVKASNILV